MYSAGAAIPSANWAPTRVPLGRKILSRNVTDLSSGVKAIAAGDEHTCALDRRLGEVLGFKRLWPGRRGRQCGSVDPDHVTGLISGVQAIAAGGSFTCALTSASGVKCWGDQISAPTDVPDLTSGVFAIAAGLRTCAVVGDAAGGGGVQCQGANDTGQLGNGTTTSSSTPVNVAGLGSGVKAIAAGGAPVDRFTSGGHTCAITTDGGVKCWGLECRRSTGR